MNEEHQVIREQSMLKKLDEVLELLKRLVGDKGPQRSEGEMP